jgi:transcriptional regulator with GAF, ATPase, and Fis domain
MRLSIKGKDLGALAIGVQGLDRYSNEHARLLSLLNEPFAIAMANALRHRKVLQLKDMLTDDNRYLHRELLRLSGDEIIGVDGGLKGVMSMVKKVAPLTSPVLLLGETGVGKELIAGAIHHASHKKDGPFITVNSGAIPETLLDSELFGHEKGAFTGAISQKRGRFERANGGTIFLDEIGELSLQAQIRMLRVLQQHEIERVGGSEPVRVDIRIIAATHRNLTDMIQSGTFREDLLFRLNVFPIIIPPLRERKNDIPALAKYFIVRKSKQLGFHMEPHIAPGAVNRLKNYYWPGNVRELENVIERALILNRNGTLDFDNFLQTGDYNNENFFASQRKIKSLDEETAGHIRRALKESEGKVHGPGGAADLLGINPSTLRNKMNRLGIDFGRRAAKKNK